jgi:phytoene dehydrogenase-like protein
MPLKIAIIGAGHGGTGLAAYLALKGYKIFLYNR